VASALSLNLGTQLDGELELLCRAAHTEGIVSRCLTLYSAEAIIIIIIIIKRLTLL